jgi:23S rRNA pseudouridine1911/1915/1917 synthase
MENLEVVVDDPVRIDKYLATFFSPHFSRTYFSYLIEEGLVLLNGAPVKKRMQVQTGDTVEIAFAETPESELIPEAIPLNILYEDDDIIVINKAAGMVVHPAPGNWSGTLVNALLHHVKTLKREAGSLRPGIVHRLDKDTTGVIIAAKHPEAQRRLIQAFSGREVRKEYLAVTTQKPAEGRLETRIGRDPKNRQQMAVLPEGGKEAVSYIKVLAASGPLYGVEVLLETGRTHQIRVHLKHLKAPILGDPIYGSLSQNKKFGADRPYLHAWRLHLKHPMTQKPMSFEAPIPQDMSCVFSCNV